MNRQLVKFAIAQSKVIGAHHSMIGNSRWTVEEYEAKQNASDAAVALCKYLIQTLDNRDHAVQLANYARMPGYINMR